MKCTSVLAFAASAMAVAIPQAGSTTALRFSPVALANGTDIHLKSIVASGLQFWIGKNTTTYCPTNAAVNCTGVNTNTTILAYFNDSPTVSLDVSVSAGQQVYVTAGDEATGQAAGELKFLPPHSSQTAGPALYDGFLTYYDGIYKFEDNDWFACPNDNFSTGYGIWAISRVNGTNAGAGCIAFQMKVVQQSADQPTAYEYI